MLIGTYQKDGALFGRDRTFANTSIRLDKNQNGSSPRTDRATSAYRVLACAIRLVNGATQTANCAPNATYVPAINPDICLFDVAPFVGLLPKTERYGLQGSGPRCAEQRGRACMANSGWSQSQDPNRHQPRHRSTRRSAFRSTRRRRPTRSIRPHSCKARPAARRPRWPCATALHHRQSRDLTDTIDATRAVAGGAARRPGWDYDGNLLYTASQTEGSAQWRLLPHHTTTPPARASCSAVRRCAGHQRAAAVGQSVRRQLRRGVDAAAKATNFLGQAFKTNTSLTGIRGKASKEMMTLEGGGLSTAFGAELRHETFRLDSSRCAGAPATSRATAAASCRSTPTRNVAGIFGEAGRPGEEGGWNSAPRFA